MKKILPAASCLLMVCAVCAFFSCSPAYKPYTGGLAFHAASGIPDYSDLNFWAAHPAKKDPADSIPGALKDEPVSSDADVFFVHPTTFTEAGRAILSNARIDDPLINAKTDQTAILYQASVFNGSCRVFAPRYRQAHLQRYYDTDTACALAAFDTAYQDVRSAFEYYLQHENQGRPIVLASHSQGSTHTQRLVSEFFDGKPLANRLVCAYLVGMPVSRSRYSHIQPCSDSLSTGCFVSWRTYRESFEGKGVSASDTTIAVINPVLWTTEPVLARRSAHQGAVLYNFNKVYRHTQNARVAGNALWISKPRFPGSFLYFTRNYHPGDINLFYVDIREDVKRRIRYFTTVSMRR
jgi:hypothetical protein